MAFIPPANNAGILPPPAPANPPALADVAHAQNYVDQLSLSARKILKFIVCNIFNYQFHRKWTCLRCWGQCSRSVQTSLMTNLQVAADQAPPWLAAFANQFQEQIQDNFWDVNQNIANLNQNLNALRFEMPVQLANSCRGNMEHLLHPGAAMEGFPLWLDAPNPRTCDELISFMSWFYSD